MQAIALISPHACRLTCGDNKRLSPPPDVEANVVAKSAVGFGEPLIVTVAAPFADVGEEPVVLEEERMVKRAETAFITPCVELSRRRK